MLLRKNTLRPSEKVLRSKFRHEDQPSKGSNWIVEKEWLTDEPRGAEEKKQDQEDVGPFCLKQRKLAKWVRYIFYSILFYRIGKLRKHNKRLCYISNQVRTDLGLTLMYLLPTQGKSPRAFHTC